MIVLALDQGTTTGWAVGEPGGTPQFGTFELPFFEGSQGPAMWAMHDWVCDMISDHHVDHLYWEDIHMPRFANMTSMFRMCGIATAIQMAACAHQNRAIHVSSCECVGVSTWRKYAIGKGNAKKEHAVIVCKALDWDVQSHHEAEACCIWLYGCSLHKAKAPATAISGAFSAV